MKNILCFLILFSLALSSNREDFANHLYKTQDFKNASLIYKELLFFETNPLQQDCLRLKLAQSLFKEEAYNESWGLLTTVIANKSSLKKEAQQELARQYYFSGNYHQAANEYQNLFTTYQSPEYLYQAGWAELQAKNLKQAKKSFQDLAELDSEYKNSAEKLSLACDQYNQLPNKNPQLAAGFSYVIPGTGQIYAENWKDGLVSFVVNGLTISLLANAIQQQNTAGILVFGSLEFAWYLGGAQSAYNSAKLFNNTQQQQFQNKLEKNYSNPLTAN